MSPPEPASHLDINGRRVPVRLRRNARARRIILRLDGAGDGVVVTLPKHVSEREGLAWAHGQETWIAGRLADLPVRTRFTEGAVIPVGGVDHVIRQQPGARRGVWCEAGEIRVSGRPEHLPRRVTDWLRAEARRQLEPRVAETANRLGHTPGRVTVRDTRSRWGSCAANGNLSFCWRLVMAPELVLDYVVAHEVAHLKEPHHGPAFWKTVETLTPHMEPARRWLRDHGEALHFYG